MRIDIHQTFKHDKHEYHEGERAREVPDDTAALFIGYGWASRAGAPPLGVEHPKSVTLDIHNGTIDLSSVFDKIDRQLKLK